MDVSCGDLLFTNDTKGKSMDEIRMLPAPFEGMKRYPQFLLYIKINLGDKIDKIPFNPHTKKPYVKGGGWQEKESLLATYDQVAKAPKSFGIGFLLKKTDPFFFLDIDKCIDPVTGEYNLIAKKLLQELHGAAVERSCSGLGLHIFGHAKFPEHSNKNPNHNIELYTHSRFAALTGEKATGDSDFECSNSVNKIADTYFKRIGTASAMDTISGVYPGWTQHAHRDWVGPLCDVALKNLFLKDSKIRALWDRDVKVLSAYYPANNDSSEFDQSRADCALARGLAFWAGKNCERVKRLMFRSGLVREKWNRIDYIDNTVLRGVSLQPSVYKMVAKSMGGVLSKSEQMEYFSGCTYVLEINKVLTPQGRMLNSEQFNAAYGGHSFQVSTEYHKKTDRAWDAFSLSKMISFPKAASTFFDPLEPFGCVKYDGIEDRVNCYLPMPTPQKQGDVTPFTDHLKKILPNANDQRILISYLAACVQHVGVKFQWAPLIQGVEGNGKTLIANCVAFCIGDRYVHCPNASEIASKFNGWLSNKVFINVEDLLIDRGNPRVFERLKTMITASRGIEIQKKGEDQITCKTCANFLLTSNYKDALPKTRNDRRFCVFYTAQQVYSDLKKSGMGDRYFLDLHDWLDRDGYAIVNHYLHTYNIPVDMNPAKGCHRAPVTSTTAEAVSESVGYLASEILEAIEERTPGFCGGWVSSTAITRLIRTLLLKTNVSVLEKVNTLRNLGYIRHPSLNLGRSPAASPIDEGKRPTLFIKEGHPHVNIKEPRSVLHEYLEDQKE